MWAVLGKGARSVEEDTWDQAKGPRETGDWSLVGL